MPHVFKTTLKRANPYAAYTAPDGTRYTKIPADLLMWIDEAAPPVDYTEDTYYRQEIADAPYVIYTPKSAEQIADTRWSKISAIRDDLWNNGGCKLEVETGVFKWFHSDGHSKLQQLALTVSGQSLPANLQWKTMDGSFVTMTPVLAAALFAAQMTREMTVFAHAEALKANPAADINAGWPERYVAPEQLP